MGTPKIKSVAIIGAGAAGAASVAAFAAEKYFDLIRVFERRETAGGTWIYDPNPNPLIVPQPGKVPSEIDPPLEIPQHLPTTTTPSRQERYDKTPMYADLTSNVPDIAMSFSDIPFPYGPFVPHNVPKQYIESYFSAHRTDQYLVVGTTVEDVSRLSSGDGWKLTLRSHDVVDKVDHWWTETFDAVVFANGHYSVPYVPPVKGLETYIQRYPGRVLHSKSYRSPENFRGKKVLVIGNSASGHDVTVGMVQSATLPVYQSRKSASRWDGDKPDPGIEWKPIVKEYLVDGDIIFNDDSVLSGIEYVVYCTGYKASFPFWNAGANGARLWDNMEDRLVGSYKHIFLTDFPSIGIVGIPRTLTFRSFEYQAIALARVWSGRNARPLPSKEEQRAWDTRRWELVSHERRKYHDIPWDNGETIDYLRDLYELAGLPQIEGAGLCPPILGEKTRWAIENLRKYPEPGNGHDEQTEGWTAVERGGWKDSLHFI